MQSTRKYLDKTLEFINKETFYALERGLEVRIPIEYVPSYCLPLANRLRKTALVITGWEMIPKKANNKGQCDIIASCQMISKRSAKKATENTATKLLLS